ncbi:GntR family transcriptional regulator [Nesterenkonia ebinurensis]|uniref:GntR family transcriptional regulator n=1 Tax=Nesterenkonia ebinurensis TaxID=2608252 RepID=UPI00123D5E9D|nr:GntR family transcriptional regulator [Nesterenkonia ebinurensis]
MKHSIKSKPVGELLAESLRHAILHGDLPAGAEIRQEKLAQEYGVSRIPVREALQTLEREGLVVVRPNRRVAVAEITVDDLKDHYDVRALIEGELASRAAELGENHAEIEASYLEGVTLAEKGDVSGLVKSNEHFHSAIWEAAGSSRLYALAQQLWTGVSPYRPVLFPERAAASIEEHKDLIDAIFSKDAEASRSAMRNHILSARDDVLRLKQGESESQSVGRKGLGE